MGLTAQGRLAIVSGRVAEGLAILDEAMLTLIDEGFRPSSQDMCSARSSRPVSRLRTWAGVEQWTKALTGWCDDQPGLLAFTGQRAIHRAQLLRFHGHFDDALNELSSAEQRRQAMGETAALAQVHLERAKLFRIRGAWVDAESEYRRARRRRRHRLRGGDHHADRRQRRGHGAGHRPSHG
ncbi:hypothetical protein FOS14_03940 [Skermania sp. ID1734]|uniref:hypothetical protein n=1 Tax=Skermania sp. ID1734 TaxID=2597516 RepID=UPI00117FDB81|nr:hypothetical protein [Skermania sp. ID1734]TSE01679.1 hypothetical protein FOS14_03940 [Skermania sp. ID1734]